LLVSKNKGFTEMVEDFDNPGTTAQIRALQPGENVSRATFIPAFGFSPDRVKETKRDLTRNFSPVIARIIKETGRVFSTHTVHSFTRDYDVIVAVIVQRIDEGDPEPEEDDEL
jgi:hypothetical protein